MLKIIEADSAELGLFERIQAGAISDILQRHPLPRRGVPNRDVEKTEVALENGKPVGHISYRLYEMIVSRQEDTGHEQLVLASLIEFPVTDLFEPPIWNALLSQALEDLQELGATRIYMYVPMRCLRYRNYLKGVGFEEIGFCDNLSYLAELGFNDTCSLFSKSLRHHGPVTDIYPYLPDSFVQLQADVRDAPVSSLADWDKAYLYSGYSGYPFFSNFLRSVVPSNVRSILSLPCATGDVLRFLPYAAMPSLKAVIGVDITPRLITFARERLETPMIDVFNRFLCWLFYQDIQGYAPSTVVRAALGDVLEAVGKPVSETQFLHIYAQMRAMFRRGVLSGAIADWFCLSKGLA